VHALVHAFLCVYACRCMKRARVCTCTKVCESVDVCLRGRERVHNEKNHAVICVLAFTGCAMYHMYIVVVLSAQMLLHGLLVFFFKAACAWACTHSGADAHAGARMLSNASA